MSINDLDFTELQKEHPEYAKAILDLLTRLSQTHMVAFEAGIGYALVCQGSSMEEAKQAVDTYRADERAVAMTTREIMDIVNAMLTPDLQHFRRTFEKAALARYGLSSQVVEV